MTTEPCPQCGYHDMSVSHDATCSECGVPVHAATPDPADHLCGPHKEVQMLVDAAISEPLHLYDRAMPQMRWGGSGGDAIVARALLTHALVLMDRLSLAVKSHDTYIYWRGEIMEQLGQLQKDAESE